MRRTLLIALLLVSSLFGARAQGQSCDPTLQVSIESIQLGGTSWVFVAVIDSGSYGIVGVSWNMGDAQASVQNGPYINFDFLSPGTYLVCLTVTAQDSLGQDCESTVCEVIVVNPAPAGLCDSVAVDFAGSFDNGAFTFALNDSIGAAVTGVDWTFGDGSYGAGDPVTHTFNGNGPYQVCMTAYLLDQMNQDTCTTTVCHWVYFGPDTLPCEQILIPSFGWSTNGLFCAFFNTSFTLGSTGSLLWDFGDGAYSTEETPIHEYPMISSYTVCLTVSLWGGLAPDTCTLTACLPIDMYPLVTVEELAQYGSPTLWPVPCSDMLHANVPQGERVDAWTLFDLLGRPLRNGKWPGGSSLDIDLVGLVSGVYVLRLERPGRSWNARFTKS
ncbi:MAG: PKD domain-containing protein [Flavobacteriales bacterium]|nr:PKD domain-containing protein [Flavobacteriales bacterium]